MNKMTLKILFFRSKYRIKFLNKKTCMNII